MLVRIDFLHPFSDSYVRTRHNNLRCFPSCARVHRDSSFCGRAVEVKILKSIIPDVKQACVFGEFRGADTASSFAPNEALTSDRIKQQGERFEIAEYVNANDNYYRYVFTPNKKWRYDTKVSRQQELHVFTVYVAAAGQVSDILNSKPFVVVPVWKACDDGSERDAASSGSKQSANNLMEDEDQVEHETNKFSAPFSRPSGLTDNAPTMPFMQGHSNMQQGESVPRVSQIGSTLYNAVRPVLNRWPSYGAMFSPVPLTPVSPANSPMMVQPGYSNIAPPTSYFVPNQQVPNGGFMPQQPNMGMQMPQQPNMGMQMPNPMWQMQVPAQTPYNLQSPTNMPSNYLAWQPNMFPQYTMHPTGQPFPTEIRDDQMAGKDEKRLSMKRKRSNDPEPEPLQAQT